MFIGIDYYDYPENKMELEENGVRYINKDFIGVCYDKILKKEITEYQLKIITTDGETITFIFPTEETLKENLYRIVN